MHALYIISQVLDLIIKEPTRQSNLVCSQLILRTPKRQKQHSLNQNVTYMSGRSMALGGYTAPTIDWTQDLQLPDRLEDFK